jgi:tetratricopeptide (TPR) repeat protein
MPRLQALLALAVVLAGVAGGTNYAYWRRGRPLLTPPTLGGSGGASQASAPSQPDPIPALTAHLARNPHDSPARLHLAELLFKRRDYARSLVELRSIEHERPRDPNVLLRQAVVWKYAGEPEAAERALRRALAIQPGYEAAWEWLGQVYLDQERNQQALEVFTRCLRRHPDSPLALLGKGRALEGLLRSRHPIPLSAVLQPVEEAARRAPENAEVLATLARMRLAYQDRVEEAEALARHAAALDPANSQPYFLLAQIALARPPTPENLRLAGEYAYEAGRRDLRDPRPPYLIGRVCLQQNDPERAIRAFERSLALGAMPETISQLAVACRRAGDASRAQHYSEIFQRYTDLLERRNALLAARERQPAQVGPVLALADLYLEARQPDTAAAWLREIRAAGKRGPRYTRLVARVGELRKQGGDAPLLPIP